jgi:hypothetical protein
VHTWDRLGSTQACNDAGVEFVLIHSPLVGPGTWEPVARELVLRGRSAVVPSLVRVAEAPAPRWRHCLSAVQAATEHFGHSLVLVGHSGAGPLLPVIADGLRKEIAALIFVDAFLPPSEGAAPPVPPPLMEQLRPLATDGVLPPWWRWFGEEGLRELLPNEPQRAELEKEMPRLPLAYFEASIPVPAGWDARPCGYLLFAGDQYGEAAADARERRWPVLELTDAHHLAVVTDPVAVADALVRLEHELTPGAPVESREL